MKLPIPKATDVDAYIASFPVTTQKLLKQVRTTIKQTVPDAIEVISYGMPAYKYMGMLVYFAGYEKHIGFYPMPSAIIAFKHDLSIYKSAKGSVQFPLDQPLPLTLIKQMVAFRKQENQESAALKGAKPKKS